MSQTSLASLSNRRSSFFVCNNHRRWGYDPGCPDCKVHNGVASPESTEVLLREGMDKWDQRFLDLASLVSSWSKDPSTKVGAVIADGKHVVSLGFNGFPPSIPDKEEWLNDREQKYPKVIHAEVNAVLNARVPVRGYTLYVTPLGPCVDCAKFIAAAGLARVVVLRDVGLSSSPRFKTGNEAEELFRIAGIVYEVY